MNGGFKYDIVLDGIYWGFNVQFVKWMCEVNLKICLGVWFKTPGRFEEHLFWGLKQTFKCTMNMVKE